MPESELRVGVLLKGALADAMIAESEKSLAQYAAITRAALVEYFEKRGYNVEDNVTWGGARSKRKTKEDNPEGQWMGTATVGV